MNLKIENPTDKPIENSAENPPENPFVICANLLNTDPRYYAMSNIMEMSRFLINDLQQKKFDINQQTIKKDSTATNIKNHYSSVGEENETKTLLMAFLNNARKIKKEDFSFIHLLIKSGADLSLEEKNDDDDQKNQNTHTWADVFQTNTELDEFLAQTYQDEFGATAFSDFLAKHNMLHDAVGTNNQSFVKFCVDNLGVDINLKNKIGETPAMKIRKGETCDFFMNYPVDWHAQDNQGKSVLVHFGAKNGDEGQKLYKRLYNSLIKGDTQPMEMKESVGDSVIEAISHGHNMEQLKSMLKNYAGKPEEINDKEGNNLLQVAIKNGRWAFYKHLRNKFSFDKHHKNLFGQNAMHTFFRYSGNLDNGDPSGNRRKEVMEDIFNYTSFLENSEYNMRDCVMEAIQSDRFLAYWGTNFLLKTEENKLLPRWVNLAAQQIQESERKDFFQIATECLKGITKKTIPPLNRILGSSEQEWQAAIAVMRLLSWNREQDNSKTLELVLTTLFEPAKYANKHSIVVNEKSAEAILFGIFSLPTPPPSWWTDEKRNQYLNTIINGIKEITPKNKNEEYLQPSGGIKLLPLIAPLLIDNKQVSTDNFNYINQWAQKNMNEAMHKAYGADKDDWNERINYWNLNVLSNRLQIVAGENVAVIKRNKI